MRYEQEILEKIMYYDPTGTMSIFPLYIYKTREKVNRQALETAVGYAIECHPLFGCRLAEDEKGSYLETNPEKPVIPDLSPDREYFYGNESNHCYPWVIGIRDREIIYTCFHGFADGIGSTIFMRTVLYYYFREQGIDCAPGKAVTLDQITPEYLEKDTELSVKKNGTKDVPSLYEARKQNPTVFPDELLEEESDHADVHNLAISLADIRKKSAEYEVSQFAVMTTYIAQAVCSVLPGTDNVVVMNIVTDMRGLLNSATTHNCVMVVPVTFAQKDLQNKSDELLCTMFRSRLDLGFNEDEVLHNCFNSVQMEQRFGGNKRFLAGAAAHIAQKAGFESPVASVGYTHLTHTGFSDDLFRLLEDVYISYSGFKAQGKLAIPAMAAVSTDKVINLMLVDGTKNELILNAIKKKLTEAQISFEARKLDRYKGIVYKR